LTKRWLPATVVPLRRSPIPPLASNCQVTRNNFKKGSGTLLPGPTRPRVSPDTQRKADIG
jgi:hypothetical protein